MEEKKHKPIGNPKDYKSKSNIGFSKKSIKDGIKKQRELSIKQKKFIDEYLETGNATEAADRVYKTKNRKTSMAIGNENLGKPMIKATIEDRLKTAKDMIYIIATTAEKDEVKLRACQDIVDRVEGKAVARVEHSGEVQQNIVYLPEKPKKSQGS